MITLALATTFIGFAMMVAAMAGIGPQRDWMAYGGV